VVSALLGKPSSGFREVENGAISAPFACRIGFIPHPPDGALISATLATIQI
jgi:hypothetical protein